ncbi:MAG TPA: SAM-dependent chlorinase/fluorinase [Sandaracinaceae bacterium]
MNILARPIFFLSDFGTRDVYAGVVEAVILAIAPSARVVHLTHGIPPHDVRNASWQLFAAAPHLPRGSIVLAVVDPGVGSSRRALVVETERLLYVAPDNGLLEAALSIDPPLRAFALEEPRFRLPEVSSTFHGRDVFGPAAAHLSRGIDPAALGPPVGELARMGLVPTRERRGVVWTFDRFGNAITTLVSADARALRAGGRAIPFARTYADVPKGAPLALAGSSGLVEISVRDGSARDALGLAEGEPVELS